VVAAAEQEATLATEVMGVIRQVMALREQVAVAAVEGVVALLVI
jgi:hypothetical protein